MRWLHARALLILLLLLAAAPAAAADSAMTFKDADIRDVLHALGELANVNVMVDPQVQATVSVFLRGMDPVEAIHLLARTYGYDYHWVNDGTVVVGPEPSLAQRFEPVRTVFFPLRYAQPRDVAAPLSFAVQPAAVQADEVRRGVLVRGTEGQLALAAELLAELDVPPPVELDFQNADLVTVFRTLAAAGGYSLLLDSPLEGTLTISLRGVDVDEAIRLAARQSGVQYRFEGNTLIVSMDNVAPVLAGLALPLVPEAVRAAGLEPETPEVAVDERPGATEAAAPAGEPAPAEPEVVRVFTLHYIDPGLARRILGLAAPQDGLAIEQVGNVLLVRAPESVLNLVESLLAQFDVPEVRVDGIVLGGGQRLAVVSIAGRSYVVRVGERVHDLSVVDITGSEVVFETERGRVLRVAVGGASGR